MNLEDAVRNPTPLNALVVGDLILDRYVEGSVERINPEAPVPVLHARRERLSLGGAANVARNLRVLGCDVRLLGVVGDDADGRALLALCEDEGMDIGAVAADPERPTTKKTRIVSRGQHMLRVDWEAPLPIAEDLEARFRDAAFAGPSPPQVAVLSDYAKGVLTPGLVKALVAEGARRGVPVLVDPKGRDFQRYAHAHLVTPNRREAEAWLGRPLADDEALREGLVALRDALTLQAAVFTLGGDGMAWLDAAGAYGRLRAEAREVFDITGAGDVVIATLAAFLGAGLALADALQLANVAAGISVGRLGTVAVGRDEILERLLEASGSHGAKIRSRAGLRSWAEDNRRRGRRIVFTNGCFDVLHRGHVEYLRFCRAQGDVLAVGLNSDASVKALKGPGRPVNGQDDRAAVLAALESVDAVAIFDEEIPEAIIREVEPDVLVKGEDWREKGVVGRDFVEGRGGRVVLAPLLPGFSTSSIVEKLGENPSP